MSEIAVDETTTGIVVDTKKDNGDNEKDNGDNEKDNGDVPVVDEISPIPCKLSTQEHLNIWIYRLKMKIIIAFTVVVLLLALFIPLLLNSRAKAAAPKRFKEKLYCEDILQQMFKEDASFTFEPKMGDYFKTTKYFGKSKLLNGFVDELILKTHLCMTKTQDDCKHYFRAEDMHSFFLGPSGTGKTQFIKRVAFDLDVRLKLIHRAVSSGQAHDSVGETDYFKLPLDERRALDAMPSRVRYFAITPSELMDKYIGNSEALLKALFDRAMEQNGAYTATIVLFDEAEAIFPKRSDSDNGFSIKNSLLSEFLSQFNRLNDTIWPVFLVAITNQWLRIDSAIKRRFFNHTHFKMPTVDELTAILENMVDSKLYTGAQKQAIINLCKENVSHSTMVGKLSENTVRDNDGNVTGFDFTGFTNAITANKEATALEDEEECYSDEDEEAAEAGGGQS
ncbi:ALF1 [Enterospora canceri]|uniref:ALF1 n=1 Tax=Enterospora canceri TaxID=1081671 RepID=A0A1Y1S578_9MICR|nr:ALF1 [Enterospora canceri]